MEEGTWQLSLVAGVTEDLTQILPEDSNREVRLPGVNSVRVHFRLDLAAWAVGAMVACWLWGRWCGPGSCSALFSSPSPCQCTVLLPLSLSLVFASCYCSRLS